MDQLREVLAVAMAEVRSARRLARTWLFSALSMVIGLVLYLYYAAIHGFASSFSATFGVVNPRYLMASVGIFVLLVFVVAIVFLAFDIRGRDQRERMAEVLDARPIGNIALLGGRLAGLILVVWVPMVLLVALIQLIGLLATALQWPIGEPVEPLSMLAFLFIDALPALFLWGAVVVLLAVASRNRLVTAIAALALIGACFWMLFANVPLYLLPALSGLGVFFSNTVSDILPKFATATDLAQRASTIAIAAGLMVAAAALYPRRDHGRRVPRLVLGAALAVAGGTGIGLLAAAAVGDLAARDDWLAAHQARRDVPRADVESVRGRVAIDPGQSLTLTLDYHLRTPPDTALDELLLSFNPGMTVVELDVDGKPARHTHELGLLSIALPSPLAAGESALLSITSTGVPDAAFAYLDSVVDVDRLTSDGGNLTLLGSEAAIYDRDYVALMPGVFWMPVPGAAVGREHPGRYGRDFYSVDLEVEAPPGWLVAGPGRREPSGDAVRFRPAAPVPEVGLVAAPFERRAIVASGVELELLMHPRHLRNVDFLADAAVEIQTRADELFAQAAKLGLAFPYETLSLVETPAVLRGYGGGWRMGSTQTLPGIMLLREYGFPTARLEFPFRNAAQFEDREGGLGSAKADVLVRFFGNDVTGGNPLYEATRNLFAFQTSARGEGAIAVDFVCQLLAARLMNDGDSGYFSVHSFSSSADMTTLMINSFLAAATGQGQSIVSSVQSGATGRATVWDRALNVPLADLDPQVDPNQALNVLWLKGPAIAQSMIDGFGREGAATILAAIRSRHTGGSFTAEDFDAAASDSGYDLEPLLGDWLHDAALPGFLASKAEVFRLADEERGEPRYQVRVHVRNDESTPGLVRLHMRHGNNDDSHEHTSAPVRVAGGESIELGLVAEAPPDALWLAPYLSLNRRNLALAVPEVDEAQIARDEPLAGSRPSTWLPEPDAGIVVDDMDAAFTIEYASAEARGRLSSGSQPTWMTGEVDMDQGLRTYQPFAPAPAGTWTRQEAPGSWGKYRHTLARASTGDGRATAVFTATLPTAGRWRLAYHLPDTGSGNFAISAGGDGLAIFASTGSSGLANQGVYNMSIRTGDSHTPVEFDGAAAELGWNDLGDFDLPAGEVSVVVSNEGTGQVVLADAVRWRPL